MTNRDFLTLISCMLLAATMGYSAGLVTASRETKTCQNQHTFTVNTPARHIVSTHNGRITIEKTGSTIYQGTSKEDAVSSLLRNAEDEYITVFQKPCAEVGLTTHQATEAITHCLKSLELCNRKN